MTLIVRVIEVWLFCTFAALVLVIAWMAVDARAAERCALDQQGKWVGVVGFGGYCRHLDGGLPKRESGER